MKTLANGVAVMVTFVSIGFLVRLGERAADKVLKDGPAAVDALWERASRKNTRAA